VRSLQGAVVAVTGASAGIGRECAVAFAREGARVAIAARRLDRLEAVAEAVRAAGSEAFVMGVDVAKPGDVKRFVDGTVARFGRLDVLVNNAGYGVRGRVEDTPVESYERLMDVNFLGTVYGCQAAVPVMRRQGSGVIINVSSIVGHRALPGGGAYAATKAAQVSLTEALRVELAGSGVHACSVHPVGTETEFGEVAARESPGASSGGAIGPQQTAAHVARSIVACAKRPRPEVYPHRLSRALVWLNAVSPSLVDWMSRRAGRSSGRL
jgi:NAD(P)-dependent dehydrogenase (short-subunit alcohol dehydrogenase family)